MIEWGFSHRWEVVKLNPEIITRLTTASKPYQMPDGSELTVISFAQTNAIARQYGVEQKNIEIMALKNSMVPERYVRNLRSLSTDDQIRLLESSVCVVGLGGLGGTVVETLTRIGIGSLILIDGDVFDESNLNRQRFSSENHIGLSKAKTAAKGVSDINASIVVQYHTEMMNPENARDLIRGADIVVDCLDSIDARFVLQDAARKAGIPLVSAAVGGMSSQMTTIFPEDSGFELIYGSRESITNKKGAEVRLGNLAFTVATVASLECAEVVKILLQRGSDLRNRLLIIDLLDYTFECIRLI